MHILQRELQAKRMWMQLCLSSMSGPWRLEKKLDSHIFATSVLFLFIFSCGARCNKTQLTAALCFFIEVQNVHFSYTKCLAKKHISGLWYNASLLFQRNIKRRVARVCISWWRLWLLRQSCLPEHKQLEVFFFTETALTPTVVSQEEDLMIMVLTETYDHLSPSQKSLYSYTCSNKADGNLTGEHHYHEKRPETATIV